VDRNRDWIYQSELRLCWLRHRLERVTAYTGASVHAQMAYHTCDQRWSLLLLFRAELWLVRWPTSRDCPPRTLGAPHSPIAHAARIAAAFKHTHETRPRTLGYIDTSGYKAAAAQCTRTAVFSCSRSWCHGNGSLIGSVFGSLGQLLTRWTKLGYCMDDSTSRAKYDDKPYFSNYKLKQQ